MSSNASSPPSCPICEKDTAPRKENKAFPFCSSRCKMEDLGKWLGGQYAMPGRPASGQEMAQELRQNSLRNDSD